MASPNLSELATTTIESRTGELADNMSKNAVLLYRLKERGKQKPVSGGRVIEQELNYAENGTYRRYAGYDQVNISPSDVMTSAEFDWKQVAVAVSISGREQLINSGKERIIGLLASRIENAEKTMVNNLVSDCYSDGTADGSKQIGGLQLLVSDAATSGTVGGINRATWSFWQNQLFDFSVAGVTAGAATMQTAMNRLYLLTSRTTDHTDLIIFDNTFYRYYWESLQAVQRITNEKMAAAGFENLKFMGADVCFDGGIGGACPANHGYFLNTDYIFYRPHRERNMTALDPDRYSVNQDAMVKLIGWMGNMTLSNAQLQGVMTL